MIITYHHATSGEVAVFTMSGPLDLKMSGLLLDYFDRERGLKGAVVHFPEEFSFNADVVPVLIQCARRGQQMGVPLILVDECGDVENAMERSEFARLFRYQFSIQEALDELELNIPRSWPTQSRFVQGEQSC